MNAGFHLSPGGCRQNSRLNRRAASPWDCGGHRSQSVLRAACFGATLAHATDQAPVLVIPGRPGIPVVINGYDASYTIVEGDWGLARPGQVSPVIVNGPLITPARRIYTGHYFPSLGTPSRLWPPRGRAAAGSAAAAPAPSYYREWGAESQQLPATIAAGAAWESARRPCRSRSVAAPRRDARSPTPSPPPPSLTPTQIARRTKMIRRSLVDSPHARCCRTDRLAVSSAIAGSPCCCAAPCGYAVAAVRGAGAPSSSTSLTRCRRSISSIRARSIPARASTPIPRWWCRGRCRLIRMSATTIRSIATSASRPLPRYWHYRHVRSVPRGVLRRPPGWFDK